MIRTRSLDTSAAAERVQFERFRRMSPSEKAALMRGLTLAVQRLAFAGLRQAHPDLAHDEIWLRLTVRRLGPETVRKIYGYAAPNR